MILKNRCFIMTKIKIGLVLSGNDAVDFIEYMKNPSYTSDADECMKNAILIDKINSERRRSENALIIITDTNRFLKDKEIRNVSQFYTYTTGFKTR